MSLGDEVDLVFEGKHVSIEIRYPPTPDEIMTDLTKRHMGLEQDRESLRQLKAYHTAGGDRDVQMAAQFIAETGSQSGSTTAAGYGFRKANHYGTAVSYRTVAEMVRDVLDYPYKPAKD